MAETSVPHRIRHKAGGAARAVGRVPSQLASGISPSFVAALAALVLVTILYTVASREPGEPRGFAEITMFPRGCTVELTRNLNVVGCAPVGRGAYRVGFARSLGDSVAVATRGSCCPGSIAASVAGDRAVVVVIQPRARVPVRASIYVP